MNILILGGTIFLGRHIVSAALKAGHEVTLFNRGQHNPDLFPNVEKIHGNRDGGLDLLKGRKWAAVIDTCGYVPRIVGASAEFLRDSAELYVFISSISVYADFHAPVMDESAPLATLADETTEKVDWETYGGLKVLCEKAAENAFQNRALIIRPGLIVGPNDPSFRFTYWVWRAAQGGEALAPGNPDALTQFIDVRDLAEWTIRMIEQKKTGIYNATGPNYPLTLGKTLETCREISKTDVSFTWINEEFIKEKDEEILSHLPLWTPPDYGKFNEVNCQKAIDDSLKFRPLEQTVINILQWEQEFPDEKGRKNALSSEREKELLRLWSERE